VRLRLIASQNILINMNNKLLIALLVAVLLHTLLGLYFVNTLNKTDSVQSAKNLGDQGVIVGLGAPESYQKQLQKRPKPQLMIKPDKKPKEIIKENTEKKTDFVIQKEEKLEEYKESEDVVEEKNLDKEFSDEENNANKKATGSSKDSSTGGQVGISPNYISLLVTHLSKHKRYPREAKRRNMQGVVHINFTVSKSGVITQREIVTSSGYNLLDISTLKMLKNAQPLPSFTPDMTQEEITLKIPIEYNLVTQ